MGLGQFDHINQMITLSVITLSDFHCRTNLTLVNSKLQLDDGQEVS
jgi:hypothetical protein